MNSLKNLLILAVLATVGYGVYVSLARNNVDTAQPPTMLNIAMPSVGSKTPPGGPLALGGKTAAPVAVPSMPPLGTAPPFAAPPSVTTPAGNPPSAESAMTPVTPYPSSSPPPTPASLSNPTATLGTPVTPEVTLAPPPENRTLAADTVRNLAPPPDMASPANTPISPAAPAAPPTDSLVQSKFAAFMDAVQKKLGEGKLADAHLALSKLYDNPDLPPEQAKQIVVLLDQLAGSVIYSRQHFLEPAYVTQQGDTLDKISQSYNIPWQLLARINGLMPPSVSNADNPMKDQPLPPGRELKVLRGPFDAVVRLGTHELTLLLQDRYAGRFSIGVGRDQPKLDGTYTVRDKAASPTYYGPDGVTITPNDPKNPLGSAWIGLTDRIGIHGVNDPQNIGRDDNRGAICVGDRDLQDLYGILSVGSRVTILR